MCVLPTVNLTTRLVHKLSYPKQENITFFDKKISSITLEITNSDRKMYYYRYTKADRQCKYLIGSPADLTLAQAREMARRVRKLVNRNETHGDHMGRGRI